MIPFSLKQPMFILDVMENGLFLEMLLAGFLTSAFICLCNTFLFLFYFGGFNIPSRFSLRFTGEKFWQFELRQSLN